MATRVDGLERWQRKHRQMAEATQRELRVTVRRGLLRLESKAKQNLTSGPYRALKTGRLRNSQTHAVDADGLGGVVGTNVEYAPHVHHGTRKMHGRPWLIAAFIEEHPRFVEDVVRTLGRVGVAR